jgi:hypothetical protein
MFNILATQHLAPSARYVRMNDERDLGLVRLRPSLPIETGQQTEVERFQSETLRPVLKLQNSLILRLFRGYLQQTKANLSQLSAMQRQVFIFNALAKDPALKHLLTGAVLGLLTNAELAFYEEHRAELARRLGQFLGKRIADQWENL